jgi:hypothetical protein
VALDKNMELMHLTAIGRTEDTRSYYILVKESLVEKPLNEIMKKIGYDDLLYYGNEEGDSPTEAKNRVDHVVAGKYDIDIVYTIDRIFLILRAPIKQQEIFRELLLENSFFEK